MTGFGNAITVEPCRDVTLTAWWVVLVIVAGGPIVAFPLPWWATLSLTITWLAACWRAYHLHIALDHRASVRRLTVDRHGACVLEFADGSRGQRASLAGRLRTDRWIVLRLRTPQRGTSVILSRAGMPREAWRALQIRLRWYQSEI